MLLGFLQTATESRKVWAAFLRELVERGLRIDLGLLVVTDGAKGLHAAVLEVFDAAAVLQRCPMAQARERARLPARSSSGGLSPEGAGDLRAADLRGSQACAREDPRGTGCC